MIVEGKRVFGFDIGDVLRIEYICDEPPLGCAWMKEPAYKNKFIAQVVKLVSPTKSLTRRTTFKIHNKFVKFQSACIFKLLYILILKVKTKEEGRRCRRRGWWTTDGSGAERCACERCLKSGPTVNPKPCAVE